MALVSCLIASSTDVVLGFSSVRLPRVCFILKHAVDGKIKGFTFTAEPGCKFVEKVSNFFSVANESFHCFDYLR